MSPMVIRSNTGSKTARSISPVYCWMGWNYMLTLPPTNTRSYWTRTAERSPSRSRRSFMTATIRLRFPKKQDTVSSAGSLIIRHIPMPKVKATLYGKLPMGKPCRHVGKSISTPFRQKETRQRVPFLPEGPSIIMHRSHFRRLSTSDMTSSAGTKAIAVCRKI